MKRLTITLSEEDFRSVMGAILKTGADFQVETVAEEPSKPVRHLQRKTADGQTLEDVVFNTISSFGGKATLKQIAEDAKGSGFDYRSGEGKARKLHKDGRLSYKGGHYYMVIGGAIDG